MSPRRRSALLSLPLLCALTSCGIPATGVVEAGGPASGIVPMTRVYFVADGDTLVGVPRRTDAPGDVESAVRLLLWGPTDAERGKRMTTRLPLPTGMPTPVPSTTATDAPATDAPPTDAPAADPPDPVTVTEHDGRVTVELSPAVGELDDLAAAQIICTAMAAQRIADPGAEPAPVTVLAPNDRRVEGTAARCPAG